MKQLGNCAYPECGEAVYLSDVLPDGKRPVIFAQGFVEVRTGGGAHGFAHGYEQVGTHVWHWDCAKAHRIERRTGGRQQSLLG